MSQSDGISITAVVVILDDDMKKAREKGIQCERFGRIKDWAISGYKEGTAIILLSTELADYECVKPTRLVKTLYVLMYCDQQYQDKVIKKL